jgi:hypothetical protein
MKCSDCNQDIAPGDATSHGADGESHAICAKRATAHGRVVDLFTAFDDIAALKRRVQDLERVTEAQAAELRRHERDIPFRIG